MFKYRYLISQLIVEVKANPISIIVVKLSVTVKLVEKSVNSHVGRVNVANVIVQ